MDGFDYETTSFVRFRDVDAKRVANHAEILSYMETARTEYLMDLLDFDTVEGIEYIVARVECDYRSPARYGDELRVGVRITEVGDRSFRMAYRVVQMEGGEVVAEGETVQVYYDYEADAPAEVPPALRRAAADG